MDHRGPRQTVLRERMEKPDTNVTASEKIARFIMMLIAVPFVFIATRMP